MSNPNPPGANPPGANPHAFTPADLSSTAPTPYADPTVTVRIGAAGFRTTVHARGFTLVADEPAAVGGTEAGPTPYDLLAAALGACTAMTLQMYADRKGWPLHAVAVELTHGRAHADDCAACEADDTARLDQLTRRLTLDGPLTDEQRQRLVEIADRCPVHQTLERGFHIETVLA